MEVKQGKKLFWHRRAAGIPTSKVEWIEGERWQDDVKKVTPVLPPEDYRRAHAGEALVVNTSMRVQRHGPKDSREPFALRMLLGDDVNKTLRKHQNGSRSTVTIDGVKGTLPVGHAVFG